jgi:hypothetical protein
VLKYEPSLKELATGKFWIGDICYVYPNKEWSGKHGYFCDTLKEVGCYSYNEPKYIDSNNGLFFTYKDTPFFVCVTRHGDGVYNLKHHNKIVGKLRVDAGLLSVVPEELIALWNSVANYDGVWSSMGGVWLDIPKDFKVVASNGDFKFAGYSIKTS